MQINQSFSFVIILIISLQLAAVNGQIRSYSDAFPNNPVISLEDTLKAIYSEPKFEIKQHHLGPNFKLHSDGKITAKCPALFQ